MAGFFGLKYAYMRPILRGESPANNLPCPVLSYLLTDYAYNPTWRERPKSPCYIISKLRTCQGDGRDAVCGPGHVAL
jgi:hypothetical protein